MKKTITLNALILTGLAIALTLAALGYFFIQDQH